MYSTPLESVSSGRTRIERTFDPGAVRQLKAESDDSGLIYARYRTR